MKKAVLCGIILSVFFVFGCVHLAIKPEEAPASDENYELVKILLSVPRHWVYKEDVFDCSNMTAYLYDFLEERGYKCKIVVGWKPVWKFHAWLIAAKNGKKFWVDYDKTIVSPEYFKNRLIQMSFDSIEDAKKIYGTFGYAREWDY